MRSQSCDTREQATGGNALKHLHPVRLSSVEVNELVHHLHRNWQLVDPQPLHLVPWVAEKTDHGDVDLLCEAPPETVLGFCHLIGANAKAVSPLPPAKVACEAALADPGRWGEIIRGIATRTPPPLYRTACRPLR